MAVTNYLAKLAKSGNTLPKENFSSLNSYSDRCFYRAGRGDIHMIYIYIYIIYRYFDVSIYLHLKFIFVYIYMYLCMLHTLSITSISSITSILMDILYTYIVRSLLGSSLVIKLSDFEH